MVKYVPVSYVQDEDDFNLHPDTEQLICQERLKNQENNSGHFHDPDLRDFSPFKG